VTLGVDGRREDRGPQALALLDAVGLAAQAEALPGELSGGMRRRVALARALARSGDALLLDEPLKELDADTALRMRDLIRERTRGKLLVLVTHNRAEAEALCDTVLPLTGPPLAYGG
jgi:ABC-type nitrate/sulfonate/bicarbonate transport system ATPase subunit